MPIVVENYAENDFHFPKVVMELAPGKKEGDEKTIPKEKWDLLFRGARPGKDEKGKDAVIPGTLEVTEEQLAEMKASPVMTAWFGPNRLAVRESAGKGKAAAKQ